MAVMSIADALKSAIAEEMRRDPTVFCIGEDEDIPGGMGGAFTVTKGLADEFGANVRSADDKGFGGTPVPIGEARVINTPIAEIMISGVCVGAVWRFPVLHDGSAGQSGGQDALYVQRSGVCADGHAGPLRRHQPRCPARPKPGELFYSCARTEGHLPLYRL